MWRSLSNSNSFVIEELIEQTSDITSAIENVMDELETCDESVKKELEEELEHLKKLKLDCATKLAEELYLSP